MAPENDPNRCNPTHTVTQATSDIEVGGLQVVGQVTVGDAGLDEVLTDEDDLNVTVHVVLVAREAVGDDAVFDSAAMVPDDTVGFVITDYWDRAVHAGQIYASRVGHDLDHSNIPNVNFKALKYKAREMMRRQSDSEDYCAVVPSPTELCASF